MSPLPNARQANRALEIEARLSVRSLVRPVAMTSPHTQLVLVEAGAALSGLWIAGGCGGDARLVRQAAEELPEDYLVRIFARAALLERSGNPLTRVVFALAPHWDRQTAAARRTIARALLIRLSASGKGELSFWATLSEPESRHELLTLVEALLAEDAGATRTHVRVRFIAGSQPKPQASPSTRPEQRPKSSPGPATPTFARIAK